MFRSLRRAKGKVRLRADTSSFEPWLGLKFERYTYRQHSQFAFFAGFLPCMLALAVGPVLVPAMGLFTVALIVLALGWALFGLWVAGGFEAAHRLVEALDETYPAWVSPGEPERGDRSFVVAKTASSSVDVTLVVGALPPSENSSISDADWHEPFEAARTEVALG
jgi:hypothetical protein